MLIDTLQHINIRCADAERTRDFYVRILGLTVGDRPPFASSGYWLYLGKNPVVHLVQRPNGEKAHSDGSGNLDHIAFHGPNSEAMRKLLNAEGIKFREAIVPRENAVQFFLHDPDGVGVELNFSR